RHRAEEPPAEPEPEAPQPPEAAQARRRSPLRLVAVNVLPPFVSKGYVRLRDALRHQA
ncbi:MAG: hypothetical protein HOY69_38095, partial [Streptomyces sp.]|nr:hypothetical protein [Streptomyces sp.]